MGNISNKVWAGTAGAGLGQALADLLTWFFVSFEHIQVPENIQSAFLIIFTCAVTFAAGYITPHGTNGAPPAAT